jgi:hypothetical protein
MSETGVSMTGMVPVLKFDHFTRSLTIKYLRPQLTECCPGDKKHPISMLMCEARSLQKLN